MGCNLMADPPIVMPAPSASWLLGRAAEEAESAWADLDGTRAQRWRGPAAIAYSNMLAGSTSALRAMIEDLRAATYDARRHEQQVREIAATFGAPEGAQ